MPANITLYLREDGPQIPRFVAKDFSGFASIKEQQLAEAVADALNRLALPFYQRFWDEFDAWNEQIFEKGEPSESGYPTLNFSTSKLSTTNQGVQP